MVERAPPGIELLERQLHDMALGDAYGAKKSSAPWETFLELEPGDVPDHLLLAILLAGSTKGSPVDVALDLLREANGDVTRLEELEIWQKVSGVSASGRARILAASELVRRLQYRKETMKRPVIQQPEDAVAILQTMALGPHEKLVALYLDVKNRVIGSRILSVGSQKFTIVDPQSVLRPALELRAAGVLLCHQHPSGDPKPSREDIDVTRRIASAGNTVGIRLVDHIVLGASGKWTSLNDHIPPSFPGATYTN